MRIFISTGEVSGDLQGAMLISSLQRQAKQQGIDLEIVALGGDRMAEAGAKLIGNTSTISAVGFWESLPYVIPTLQLQHQAKKYLQTTPPDILVLIDYPGPNQAIAQSLRYHLPQVPIVYYIAPQDWAVPRLGNSQTIAKITDKLLAIFPQEAKFYRTQGIDVSWVGHPLLDRIKNVPEQAAARSQLNIDTEATVVTLVPASRLQELKYLLPPMLEAAQILQQHIPELKLLIPLSLGKYRKEIIKQAQNYQLSVQIVSNNTLEAIKAADLAITKSGTVSLEIALLNVPQVVIYKVSKLTAWLARNILKLEIPLMSPVNLILDKELVPELQQEAVTGENIAKIALNLLQQAETRAKIMTGYQVMRESLGELGVSDRAATEIIKLANNANNS